ncbi:MAG: proton-conducting transporter membrane subunit, partial [candidate division WOR-3 bacterium]
YATGTRDMNKLGGLQAKMPISSVSWFIGSFAASGVPPFNGFWSKLILIIAAVQAQHYILAGIAGLAAILTLASFIKVQRKVFMGNLPDLLSEIKEVPKFMSTTMVILAVCCVGMAVLLIPPLRERTLDLARDAVLLGTQYAQVVFSKVGM